jgi:hypothetical protein
MYDLSNKAILITTKVNQVISPTLGLTQSLTLNNETNMESALNIEPENTKGGSITVRLASCLTGLETAV